MVRTKADRVPTKAVGSKASRKLHVATASKTPGKLHAATPSKKSNGRKNAGGGNPYHPRETPQWQKPITSFMNMNTSSKTTLSTDNENNKESPAKENIENQASNFKDTNAEESSTDDESDDDEETN